MNAETDQAPLEEEERILCPSCLRDNDEGCDFCQHCGEPFSWYPYMGSVEGVYARGDGVRRETIGRPSLLLMIPVWLYCPPAMVAYLLGVGVCLVRPSPLILECVGFALLCGASFYYKTREFQSTRATYGEYGSVWTGVGQLLAALVLFLAITSALIVVIHAFRAEPDNLLNRY